MSLFEFPHGCGWCGIAAILLAGACAAQVPGNDGSPISRESPAPSTSCSGPLGRLLPECQGGRSIDVAPVTGRPQGRVAPQGTYRSTAAPETQPPASEAETPGQAPTEFQRFTVGSFGEPLPVFGASLFNHVPTTFAPLDRIPVTADYVLGPGDEILLRAWGQVELDLALTLDRAGAVFVPQVGSVTLAGLEYRQLGGYLRSQLARVFRNFDVNVNMGQLRSIQIFVVGQARRPGSYTVSSLSTLVNALFASGGPSAQGSMRRIQLKRGIELASEFDLYDLLLRGDKSRDVRLLPGDVVYIPPAGPQVAIGGSVKNAAIYELKDARVVGDLIAMAGGLSSLADRGQAVLERIRKSGSREVLELRLDESGLKTELADGDVLHVRAILPRFENAVTLRGNVANPGRFAWRAGLRLRDIIPDKESLVTRDYWAKRNRLGFFAPEFTAPEASRNAVTVEIDGPQINWSYAVIERRQERDLSTELVPFGLGKLVLDRDETENRELRPGDVVTIFSQSDLRVAAAQQTRFVRLEGEFRAAGIYPVADGETLGNLIERAGGLTSQAYLFGAEFLRESARAGQQLRLDQFVRELEHAVERGGTTRLDGAVSPEEAATVTARLESERRMVERLRGVKATGRIVLHLPPEGSDLSKIAGMQLENGDRFVVPSRPATVNVLGAVYNQNSFLHEPQLRIADYLRQAGGPTRAADRAHIFVIRADGSVVPKQGSGIFTRPFEADRLNPGDSIVVPEAIFKSGVLRGLRDWTQVFAQLALGAAAINVLR